MISNGEVRRGADNSSRLNGGNMGSGKSYVKVVKASNMVGHMDTPVIVLDEECVNLIDLSSSLMGRVKEFASLTNLKTTLLNVGFVDLAVRYLGELWVLLEFSSSKTKEAFRDNVGVGSWFSELKKASLDIHPDGRIVWVEVEGISLKLWTVNTFKMIAKKWGDLIDAGDMNENCLHSKRICLFTKSYSNNFETFKIILQGKVFWIHAKEVPGWVPDLLEDSDIEEQSVDGSMEDVNKVNNEGNDGVNSDIDEVPEIVFDNSSGLKGDKSDNPFGLYSLSNKNSKVTKDKIHSPIYPPGFTPDNEANTKCDRGENFVNGNIDEEIRVDEGVSNNMKSKGDKVESMNTGRVKKSEAPRSGGSFLNLMEEVVKVGLAQKAKKDWVRELCVKNKVNFLAIQETKKEKIDLFNVRRCWGNCTFDHLHSNSVGNSGGILCVWDPNAFRKSNHTISDYFVIIRGVWIKSGIDLLIIAVYAPHDSRDKQMLWDYLVHVINQWHGEAIIMGDFNEVRYKSDRFGSNFNVQGAGAFNSFIVNAGLEEVPLGGKGFTKFVSETWNIAPVDTSNGMRNMMGKLKFLKSKIWVWVKSNRCERKVLSDNLKEELRLVDKAIDKGFGTDEVVQKRVQEFLLHFQNRFDKPAERRAIIEMCYPRSLSSEQRDEIEHEVTKEELKMAVWDCGTDKSPGPDGYTFGFYRKFWSIIENDMYAAVKHLFNHGDIPVGCNASFIALILKILDANLVKDFRPISLIGSTYKIIAKILANRLVVVLGDIVNEVQSAFIAGRQILDGPFSLNEVLHWCNKKKKKSLIFKCCLKSSRGSILVNGSPTDEFQFFKGLKQGDPLSPFLFILIMESLHLSFQRVIDDGLFKGINLNHSLCLSHMFYADDAVFVRQWSDGNINTLIHVLDCFYHASGLRINMSKSKIMGVHVENAYVNQAASKLGCLVLNSPFSFLGTKVGEAMSRIQAWKEVVEKVKSRLSKWKMKTLSIGGRLTLLKSVLGSIPIFHMSIFRVPSRVLHVLESIRGHFFNGHEMGSNKATWVKWNYVLTDKKHGGLGVITAIHGDYDKVESRCHAVGRSCWLSIVNEVRILKNKGMNIFDFMNLKLGNGDTTRFWTDRWYAGGIIKDLCPRLFALDNCKEISLDSLAEVVRSINLVSSADRWIWNLESSGEFSVASARKKIDEIRFPIVKDATRWVKCVPIKVNILAWKIRNDALPTRFNISRRGIDIQSISCPICENGVESSKHLFFKCYLIREIGCKIASWWNINYVEVNSYEE
ncbi:RNA-directed DNA polymerase, eukaryota, reverse transcriptase zinc-binding domain protein [Tanacetum coccineum]